MKKLIFIDTETSGTDSHKNALLQLSGIIVIEGQEKASFNYHIAPFDADTIEDSALTVNGIKREDFVLFSKPKDIHSALIELFAEHVDKFDKRDKFFFVGYNGRFDYDFVRAFFEKCGDVYFGSWFYFPPIDVMNLLAFKLMEQRPTMPNFKLSTVANALGFETSNELHDALYDIKLTKQLFDKTTI